MLLMCVCVCVFERREWGRRIILNPLKGSKKAKARRKRGDSKMMNVVVVVVKRQQEGESEAIGRR